MTIKDWNIEEMTGYKPKTTFYTDFSLAEPFGISAVIDTFNRAFKEWKNNVEYFTELVMVLNWKVWEHHEENRALAMTYQGMWEKLANWAFENLKGEDLKYFIRTLD